MEKTRDIQKELKNLRKEVMNCFRKIIPSKEFRAVVMMAIVKLHMIEAGIHKTLDIEERRRLTNEFRRGRKGIERKIRTFKQHNSRGSKDQGEGLRRAVS